jgi:hypothetical protein
MPYVTSGRYLWHYQKLKPISTGNIKGVSACGLNAWHEVTCILDPETTAPVLPLKDPDSLPPKPARLQLSDLRDLSQPGETHTDSLPAVSSKATTTRDKPSRDVPASYAKDQLLQRTIASFRSSTKKMEETHDAAYWVRWCSQARRIQRRRGCGMPGS